MKKSKQKRNKQNHSKQRKLKEQRRQKRKLKMQDQQNEQSVLNLDEVSPEAAAERRAALLARYRQSQWNQKVKAGKAAAARVEKRYNRGG